MRKSFLRNRKGFLDLEIWLILFNFKGYRVWALPMVGFWWNFFGEVGFGLVILKIPLEFEKDTCILFKNPKNVFLGVISGQIWPENLQNALISLLIDYRDKQTPHLTSKFQILTILIHCEKDNPILFKNLFLMYLGAFLGTTFCHPFQF